MRRVKSPAPNGIEPRTSRFIVRCATNWTTTAATKATTTATLSLYNNTETEFQALCLIVPPNKWSRARCRSILNAILSCNRYLRGDFNLLLSLAPWLLIQWHLVQKKCQLVDHSNTGGIQMTHLQATCLQGLMFYADWTFHTNCYFHA